SVQELQLVPVEIGKCWLGSHMLPADVLPNQWPSGIRTARFQYSQEPDCSSRAQGMHSLHQPFLGSVASGPRTSASLPDAYPQLRDFSPLARLLSSRNQLPHCAPPIHPTPFLFHRASDVQCRHLRTRRMPHAIVLHCQSEGSSPRSIAAPILIR